MLHVLYVYLAQPLNDRVATITPVSKRKLRGSETWMVTSVTPSWGRGWDAPESDSRLSYRRQEHGEEPQLSSRPIARPLLNRAHGYNRSVSARRIVERLMFDHLIVARECRLWVKSGTRWRTGRSQT